MSLTLSSLKKEEMTLSWYILCDAVFFIQDFSDIVFNNLDVNIFFAVKK